MSQKVLVIGAGLAGSELSYFLANHGVEVVLAESKGLKKNPAQKLSSFAELVCTNSLKSKLPHTAHGLLKEEMKFLGSLVLEMGERYSVPAGDALAVDRVKFSQGLSERLKAHPKIRIIEEDVANPLLAQEKWGADYTVMATGPLTNDGLSHWLKENIFGDELYFYDAIAPVVDAESLDFSKLYFKDRYKDLSQNADYLNIPLTEKEYDDFISLLQEGEKVPPKDFEEYRFFESCLPVDLMAERGRDTLRFSCMKPVGLELPSGKRPFAVVQLRKENLQGEAYNLVGFQTRLTYPEQRRIFKTLPGLENADFIHLGSVHRNTFINAKAYLNEDMSLKKNNRLYFAGQITGVEGYTESASSGLYVAFQLLQRIKAAPVRSWPKETGMGALIHYLMTAPKPCPSSINFGLLPPVSLTKEQRKNPKRKKIKKELACERARLAFQNFMNDDERS